MPFTFLLLLITSTSISAIDPCETPNGQNGDCKPINQCDVIYNYFNNPTLSKNTRDFLRQSQCGRVGNFPKVCCPIGSTHPSLFPETCGLHVESKIIGGNVTGLDEFPWMVLLEYKENGKIRLKCGGSLISKRYVLTAKHCLKPGLVSVRLGEYNTQTNPDVIRSALGDDQNEEFVSVGVEEQIPFNGDNAKLNDIALLRLNREVEYTDFIKPVCLPSADEVLSIGEQVTVSGWGATQTDASSSLKLKVQLPVQPPSVCNTKLRSTYNGEVQLNEAQLCAGGEKGKDSCFGDSGGPLMAMRKNKNKENHWKIFGIVSFGSSTACGEENAPTVYVSVPKYLKWIVDNVKP